MLVIISLSRLDDNRLAIRVARPQHDSNRAHEYLFVKDVRGTLSDFGISEGVIDSHLKLLAQMSASQQLKFAPMDVPQHVLLLHGFRL